MQDNEFYLNSDLKKRFLDKYTGSTKKNYSGALKKVSLLFEKKYNRDIYTANSEDVNDIIYMINAKTANAANAYRAILANYVDFCIMEGYDVPSTINWFNIITKDDLKRMIRNSDVKTKIYLTRYELYEVAEEFKDEYFYIVPYILAFESVRGDKWSELFNLKKTDLDFEDNTITIKDPKNNSIIRVIKSVDKRSMDIIFKGLKNRSIFSSSDRNQYSDSDYVVKGTKNEPINYNTFYGKYQSHVTDVLGMKFSPLIAWRSGIYEKLIKQQKKYNNKELTPDDYKKIMRKFGTKQYYINIKDGYETVREDLYKRYLAFDADNKNEEE